MRAGKPTADEWECLLDDLDLPSYSKVTQTLANARDLSWCAAEDLVDDALQDGILVEDLDAGTYGVIRFAGDCDNRSTEPDSADENTTPDADASASPDAELGAPTAPEREAWSDADFSTPESGVWPSALLEREQWMGHIDKKPFAPWADRDHADAASDEDARWKWGITENYVDGETISMAEDDHRLDGRAFLQQPDDPFLYVDGDDVRDPETREIHPTFIEVLNELGLTYADISQSDAGVHAIYKGGLPEGVKQASWQLDDEPWGANDDLPSIEIYPGKRVCVMTGEHVPGTPTEVRECDEDGLEAVLEEHDQLPSREKDPSNALEDFDAQEYDPGATTSDETTDDRRDQFYAIDRLDAQRVATKTIVKSWNDDASTSEGERAFIPTWGSNSDNGTANIVNADRWQDTGDRGGYGGPVCMAAIDCPDLSITDRDCPGKINGQTWVRAVDHLRNLGFDIPEYDQVKPNVE